LEGVSVQHVEDDECAQCSSLVPVDKRVVCNEESHEMNRLLMERERYLAEESFRDVLENGFDRVLRSDSWLRGVAFLNDLLVESKDLFDGGIHDVVSHALVSSVLGDNRF